MGKQKSKAMVRAMKPRTPKFKLFILGCQFNYYDGEKLAFKLERLGYCETASNDADLIFVFACSVRQKAVDRLVGHIRNWRRLPKKPCIIVTACVLPLDQKKLQKVVDAIVDPSTLISNPKRVLERYVALPKLHTNKTPKRKTNHQLTNKQKTAYVTISAGCNNFCTYCAVPITRGREMSKPENIIVKEIKEIVSSGVDDIILLGQNVNSYGLSHYFPRDLRKDISPAGEKWTKNNPSPFVSLLHTIEKIKGLKKISFLSPNPQDMTDDLISWMASSAKFSKNLNFPMQSGSNRILRKMNRRYTRTHYMALVKKIRKAVPQIFLSTDIIVGFPGETENDFNDTVEVAKKCHFNKAFIAQYSKREGTAACLLADDVAPSTKKKRWEILNTLINN